MAVTGYITDQQGAFIAHILGKKLALDGAALAALSKDNLVLFCDLDRKGLALCCHLRRLNGALPQTRVHDLRIYYIRTGGLIIKNSALFGLNLIEGDHAFYKSVNDAGLLCWRYCRLGLSSDRVNSLQAVAGILIDRLGPGLYKEFSDTQLSYINQSYFGGRRESKGAVDNADAWYYDYPSMYGNIMTCPLPYDIGEDPECGLSVETPGYHEVSFSRGGISSPFGSLPKRSEGGTKYLSEGRGVFWYEELLYHLERGGAIDSVHSTLRVRSFNDSLRLPIGELMQDKSNGNKAAKLVVNSIYGRFASRPITSSSELVDAESTILEGRMPSRFVIGGELAIVERPNALVRNVRSNRAIASAVTSRGRVKLLRLIDSLVLAGFDVARAETDSVLVSGGSEVLRLWGLSPAAECGYRP